MLGCWRRLILPGLLLVVAAPVAAQQYLFVFHAGVQASVYDPATLELLARPAVGPGAVRAIGVPDQVTPSSFSKIYVVRRDAVVVLDAQPPFAVRATLALRAPLSLGERSALLTQDSRRLVLAGGPFLHVFDAVDPTNPGAVTIDFGAEISSLVPECCRA